ncbi:pilus assembly PilX family protein [Novilysobacter erysipheiresistens]|uniref:PilX N-terminal domain-containing pilus assembly protein n=1 Tax=Novilysobacter erysipheiresistens TaxID=1749332 RepID=A0ABU7YTT3_9GAMM
MNRTVRLPPPSQTQRGVALIVVLLLLLVVTLLGLASMRGTLLQERMAGNVLARGQAFQAAESALRVAEAYAATKPVVPGDGCSGGVCAMPGAAEAPPWQAAGFWDTAANYRRASAAGVSPVLKYVVEDYGQSESDDCTGSIDMSSSPCANAKQVYRITVLSQATNGAEVMLQSTFEVPVP